MNMSPTGIRTGHFCTTFVNGISHVTTISEFRDSASVYQKTGKGYTGLRVGIASHTLALSLERRQLLQIGKLSRWMAEGDRNKGGTKNCVRPRRENFDVAPAVRAGEFDKGTL
jgi:hypothetical protein